MQEEFVLKDKQEKLAHTFIEEYLHNRGQSFETLRTLPPEDAKQLMIKASIHASLKLAEIEERAQMVTELRHATESLLTHD
ncbi:MAG: hypothetical protein IT331_16640 [Anaerolineae bacterium]|nr:hypothetical protein [Anaerolineae bacterium]